MTSWIFFSKHKGSFGDATARRFFSFLFFVFINEMGGFTFEDSIRLYFWGGEGVRRGKASCRDGSILSFYDECSFSFLCRANSPQYFLGLPPV